MWFGGRVVGWDKRDGYQLPAIIHQTSEGGIRGIALTYSGGLVKSFRFNNLGKVKCRESEKNVVEMGGGASYPSLSLFGLGGLADCRWWWPLCLCHLL